MNFVMQHIIGSLQGYQSKIITGTEKPQHILNPNDSDVRLTEEIFHCQRLIHLERD